MLDARKNKQQNIVDDIKDAQKYVNGLTGVCGSSPMFITTRSPYYSSDSTRIYFEYNFVSRFRRTESAHALRDPYSELDCSVSFIYHIKFSKIRVLDRESLSEMAMQKWVKKVAAIRTKNFR